MLYSGHVYTCTVGMRTQHALMQISSVGRVQNAVALKYKELPANGAHTVTVTVLSAFSYRVFEDPHIAGIADLSNTLIYALSHLTALQANSLGSAAVNAARAHTVQQYLHALSAIPSLTSLELTRAPISAAAAALLPAHIHSLVLDVCRLPMGMSLAHMPALQALDMVGATPPRVLSPPDIAGRPGGLHVVRHVVSQACLLHADMACT